MVLRGNFCGGSLGSAIILEQSSGAGIVAKYGASRLLFICKLAEIVVKRKGCVIKKEIFFQPPAHTYTQKAAHRK